MRNFIILIVFLIELSINVLYAQENHTQDVKHESKEHSERTAVYEIITSGIYSYNPETKFGATGTELHFTYWFNHVWGTGLGYTVFYGEENVYIHQLALLGSYNPTSWLTINAGPSFTLPNDHNDLRLAGYVETEFNYRVREWLHFGPVIGMVASKETELTVGFNIGFEF